MNKDKIALISYIITALLREFEDANQTGVMFDENEHKKIEEKLRECVELLYE